MQTTITAATHTPGPWHVSDGGIRPTVCTADDAVLIAELADTGDEMEANGRLMAAAPSTLEALRQVKDSLELVLNAPYRRLPQAAIGKLQEAVRIARAAIAQAEGL